MVKLRTSTMVRSSPPAGPGLGTSTVNLPVTVNVAVTGRAKLRCPRRTLRRGRATAMNSSLLPAPSQFKLVAAGAGLPGRAPARLLGWSGKETGPGIKLSEAMWSESPQKFGVCVIAGETRSSGFQWR